MLSESPQPDGWQLSEHPSSALQRSRNRSKAAQLAPFPSPLLLGASQQGKASASLKSGNLPAESLAARLASGAEAAAKQQSC